MFGVTDTLRALLWSSAISVKEVLVNWDDALVIDVDVTFIIAPADALTPKSDISFALVISYPFCILTRVKIPLPASIAVSTTQSRFSSS